MLAQLLKEPCFNQLRTIEQLGYLVFSGVYRVEGIEAFRIIIQSVKMGPKALNERIESFLQAFPTTLTSLSEEEFQVRNGSSFSPEMASMGWDLAVNDDRHGL